MQDSTRYIVLPAYGFTGSVLGSRKLQAGVGLLRLDARAGLLRLDARAGLPDDAALADDGGAAATTMTVLDAIRPDGPKLVEMTPQAEMNLRAEMPGLKIIPIVTYRKMRAEHFVRKAAGAEAAAGDGGITVKVVDAASGAGVAGARVVAFTDFRNRAGDEGVSGPDGSAALRIREGARLDRLYVYGPPRYWGYFAGGIDAARRSTIGIAAIDLGDPNLLMRRLYGAATDRVGAGVTVGVIDSGIAKRHPNLPGVEGANMVFDELQADPSAVDEWGPATNDGEHGTHVAGIIGARASRGLDLVGVAPGVALRSYRVFPNTGGDATNYDIMKAIDRAVADGCHVINLSLGGGEPDEGVRSAIGAALDAGCLVVAAAGNDHRRPVSFPATLDACVAVSAMGRKSSFPSDSSEVADVTKPYGTDPDEFIAAFSNFGPQIDLTGPGVGIVSTLPDDTFGVMSGTSMAAPAIAGFAARLMMTDPDIRDASPSNRVAIWKAKLFGLGVPQAFGRDYEGSGLPLDAVVS
ncbi:MAG: S8 family serine peptidase [Methylobacterium radiotolerans]